MNTDDAPDHATRPAGAAILDTDARWWVMLDEWARYYWQRLTRDRSDDWPPPWAIPALCIAGLAVAVAVFVGLLLPVARWLAHFVLDAANLLNHWALARVALDPIHHYLDAHAAGLPITSTQLWWTWCATGLVLAGLSTARVLAARTGWVLFGSASVAMVWTTPGPSHTTAAGIAALWWIVFSLPALRRGPGTRYVVADVPPLLARLFAKSSHEQSHG
jgi:hypothetical protein